MEGISFMTSQGFSLLPPQILQREVGRLQEDHLAALPDAKWPLLTVARLKEAQVKMIRGC